MNYSLDNLNSYCSTPELQEDSQLILSAYRKAIEDMLNDTLFDDTTEMLKGITSKDVEDDANIVRIATSETNRRVVLYTDIFFADEIERLMDLFNSEDIEPLEFKIRCEILTALKDSAKTQFEEFEEVNNG